jgi:hypothetical protein
MKKTTSLVLLMTGAVILGTATGAIAQTPPTKNIFVDVNFGVQPQSHTFSTEAFPIVYNEVAIINSTQGVDGSAFMDVQGGYRVWRDLSAGLGLTTTFTVKGDANVEGGIPHPIFYDTYVNSTQTVQDLEHREQSIHLFVMWTSPVTDKIDASVSFGPSYVKVFQDVVIGANIPGSQGPQSFTPVSDQQTATTWGFNLAGDVTFLITPRIGVGGMLRYVGAKADLPAVPDLEVGGFQVGGGVRIRF